MCCFSGKVKDVYDTAIFCRMGAKGNQVVIYSMGVDTDMEVAMILPVPIAEKRRESSVQFVNLSLIPEFFEKLDRAFPAPRRKGADPFAGAIAEGVLAVKTVGSFEASFVPTVNDFDRLDDRFRIPKETWQGLPEFMDHGFVVFKLRSGRARVHPMAFAYPARDTSKITFPTVHIHDGTVHAKADFDHVLYCQTDNKGIKMDWQESVALPGGYMNLALTHGTVRPDEHVYKRSVVGEFENEDIVVPAV